MDRISDIPWEYQKVRKEKKGLKEYLRKSCSKTSQNEWKLFIYIFKELYKIQVEPTKRNPQLINMSYSNC